MKAEEFLIDRQVSYKLTLGALSSPLMMKDLADFCRANTSTFHANERVHAVLEGRREVWLRIRDHLDLSPEELWEKINPGVPYNPTGDDTNG